MMSEIESDLESVSGTRSPPRVNHYHVWSMFMTVIVSYLAHRKTGRPNEQKHYCTALALVE